jgi:hypothetical protein
MTIHDPSNEVSQAEKRRLMRDEAARQRYQGSTYNAFARADAEIDHGRFAAVNKTAVVGTEAARYPAASSAHQTELPPEPPTGYCIEMVERND